MRQDCREPDRELARGVAKGDEVCVAAFFSAYHAGVYRYMLCLTGHPEDAEDLAQDSLIRAKQNIRTYRGDAALKTWVHRVAFHTFTHWNRGRRPTRSIPDEELCPSRSLEQVDTTQALLEALTRLGSALAHPLVLQEIGDMSVDEIARVLDIPTGTVKSRLHAARARLRQLLGDIQE